LGDRGEAGPDVGAVLLLELIASATNL
jgi:hypothetical protein